MTDAVAEDTMYVWMKLSTATMIAFVATFGHRWITVHAAACSLALQRSRGDFVKDGDFVKRLTLERAFSAALHYNTVLVYGERGNGKTTFIIYSS